jgi:hypothetical protein
MKEKFNYEEMWYEKYETLSMEGKYELIKETLSNCEAEDFLEKVEIGYLLIEVKEYLLNRARTEELILLVEVIKHRYPNVFKEEFPYLVGEIISYYLLINNDEKVAEYIKPFIENPIKGIDEFIDNFKKLIYYGYDKLYYEAANRCWKTVAESPEIINGEVEFIEALYYDLVKKIYIEIRSGNSVDAEKALNAFENLDFDMSIEDIQGLIEEMNAFKGGLNIDFSKDSIRAKSIKLLRGAFIHYMFTDKNVDFMAATLIFDNMIRCWENREMGIKDNRLAETYFSITIEELDDYLEDRFKGLLFEDIISEAALLWGIPYVYQFLYNNTIISESLLERTISGVNGLKEGFMEKNSKYLWECSFVHRWIKHDYQSGEDFEEEANRFKDSLNEIAEEREGSLLGLGFDNKGGYFDEDADYIMEDLFKEIADAMKKTDKKKEKAKKKAAKE